MRGAQNAFFQLATQMSMILAYSKEVNIIVLNSCFLFYELHFLSYLFEVLHPSSQALGFVVYF